MRAYADVQDCAMRVPQGQPHLRVMSMSGVVCQRRAPYLTGRATYKARTTQVPDGYGDGKMASKTHEGGEYMDMRRRLREMERTGP